MRAAGIVFFVAVYSVQVFGHAMSVDYTEKENTIIVEVYFPQSGGPVSAAFVRVEDASGRIVSEGATDQHGVFDFKPAGPGPFNVIAERGPHSAGCRISGLEDGAEAGGKPEKDTKIVKKPVPVVAVIAGISIIFSVSAFLMAALALRKAEKIVKLMGGDGVGKGGSEESGGDVGASRGGREENV